MFTVGTMWSVFHIGQHKVLSRSHYLIQWEVPRSKLTPESSFKLLSRDSLTCSLLVNHGIMSVYLKYKPFNAELWHDKFWWVMTLIIINIFNSKHAEPPFYFCSRASQQHWMRLLEWAVSCPISVITHFLRHFFLFLVGLIFSTAEVNECVRWLRCSVEKLLLPPLKWLVRRITKTVYHTLFETQFE